MKFVYILTGEQHTLRIDEFTSYDLIAIWLDMTHKARFDEYQSLLFSTWHHVINVLVTSNEALLEFEFKYSNYFE